MRKRIRLLEMMQSGMKDSGLEPDLVDPILSEAEDGSAPAQFIVASALERSGGFEEALEWYRLSARQGYRPAQERLRRCHRDAA
jgi:TPR repeat protein